MSAVSVAESATLASPANADTVIHSVFPGARSFSRCTSKGDFCLR